ncbi:MAG TPA: hypothetical protein VHY56_10360, partial [Candidatus Binataceae bacterium]|nr:hypothetical protein [Candidatus Binataceae bacterium]
PYHEALTILAGVGAEAGAGAGVIGTAASGGDGLAYWLFVHPPITNVIPASNTKEIMAIWSNLNLSANMIKPRKREYII